MKSLKISFIASFILATCLFISCNQSSQQSTETSATDSTAVQTPPVGQNTIAMVVSHHVKDFATWKPFFDSHESARQASQLTVLGVFQDDADPNYVSVSSQVGNIDSAKAFVASPDLKATMEKAGVTDQPEIKFYEFLQMDEAAAASSANRLFFVMKVPDFEAFKAAYTANDSLRAARGISTVLIAKNLEDPSEVAIAQTAASMDILKQHAGSPEVKAAMEKVGVIGEPYIQFAKKAPGSPM